MKTIVLTTTMLTTEKCGVSAFIMCDADLVQTVKNIIAGNSDADRKSETVYTIGGELSKEQIAATDLKIMPKWSDQDDTSAAIELKKLLALNSTGRVLATNTSGHLANNGGIRGHSAGTIYPWRIMAQGLLTSLKWHVIAPNGKKINTGYSTPQQAMTAAVVFKELES
jgi:hypothetical protein